MAIDREIEFKQMLDEQTYNKIIQDFNLQNPLIQHNDYFDTKDYLLKQKGMALRIRHVFNTYELTLKVPQTKGLLEYNDTLSQTQASSFKEKPYFIDSEALNYLTSFISIHDLHCIVSFDTMRYVWPYKNGELFLDKNTMPFHQDFELEYEVTSFDTSINDWHALLQTYKLTPMQAKSKVYRAVHSKKIDS